VAGGAPAYVLGVPDPVRQVTHGLGVPGLLSVLVHGDASRPVTALDRFPRADWPPVGLCFQTYHLMVALGMTFIGLTLLAATLRWRGRLYQTRWLLWVFVVAVVGPILANQSGWAAAEIGRQPWVVYGLLRTRDAVSPAVPPAHVGFSILLFSCIYAGLLALWIFVLDSKIRRGPEPAAGAAPHGGFLDAAARHHPGGESLSAEE